MKYEAIEKDGELIIKPNIIKKANGDIEIHAPSLQVIQDLKIKQEKEKNGIRNL